MTPEQFDTLLEHIESGDTLKASIKAAQTSWRALSLYLESGGEGPSSPASRYARARTVSADFYADKAQEAVEQAVTPQDAALARVRAEVYRWRSKVADPRRYSDKVDITTDGQSMVSGVIVMPAPLPVGAPGIAATARIVGELAQPVATPEDSHDMPAHNAT